MNAFLLVIPMILIRYGLLRLVNKEALKRASFFAPLVGIEKGAFWVYQITTALMLLYLFFLKIRINSEWFYVGLLIYSFGVVLYVIAVINYAKPEINGINLKEMS